MPKCRDCGSFVTSEFVRVFGRDGVVYGCNECTEGRAVRKIAGLEEINSRDS